MNHLDPLGESARALFRLAGGVDDEASNRLQSEPCDGCDSGPLIRVRGHSLTLSIIANHAWRRLDRHSLWRRWEATGCVLYWPR